MSVRRDHGSSGGESGGRGSRVMGGESTRESVHRRREAVYSVSLRFFSFSHRRRVRAVSLRVFVEAVETLLHSRQLSLRSWIGLRSAMDSTLRNRFFPYFTEFDSL